MLQCGQSSDALARGCRALVESDGHCEKPTRRTNGRIMLSSLARYVQEAVPVLLQSLQNTFARERQIADRLADDMPQGIG